MTMSRSKYLLLYRFSGWHKDNDVLVPVNIRLVNKSYSIEMNKWYASTTDSVYSYMGTRQHGTNNEYYSHFYSYQVYNRGNYIVKYDNGPEWLYKVKNLRIKLKYVYESKYAIFSYKPENRYFYKICLSKKIYLPCCEYPCFLPELKDVIMEKFDDPLVLTMWMLKQIELGVI